MACQKCRFLQLLGKALLHIICPGLLNINLRDSSTYTDFPLPDLARVWKRSSYASSVHSSVWILLHVVYPHATFREAMSECDPESLKLLGCTLEGPGSVDL